MEISIKTVPSADAKLRPVIAPPHRACHRARGYQGMAWQCQCIWQDRSDGQP